MARAESGLTLCAIGLWISGDWLRCTALLALSPWSFSPATAELYLQLAAPRRC